MNCWDKEGCWVVGSKCLRKYIEERKDSREVLHLPQYEDRKVEISHMAGLVREVMRGGAGIDMTFRTLVFDGSL